MTKLGPKFLKRALGFFRIHAWQCCIQAIQFRANINQCRSVCDQVTHFHESVVSVIHIAAVLIDLLFIVLQKSQVSCILRLPFGWDFGFNLLTLRDEPLTPAHQLLSGEIRLFTTVEAGNRLIRILDFCINALDPALQEADLFMKGTVTLFEVTLRLMRRFDLFHERERRPDIGCHRLELLTNRIRQVFHSETV